MSKKKKKKKLPLNKSNQGKKRPAINKKAILIPAAAVLATALIVALVWFIVVRVKISKSLKLPQNTDLDFWVCMNVENLDFSDYQVVFDNQTNSMYTEKKYELSKDGDANITPEECVTYMTSPWPDYSDENIYIVRINVSDPEIKVMGLTVDTDTDTFIATLRENGFTITDEDIIISGDNVVITAHSYRNYYTVSYNRYENTKTIIIETPVTDKNGYID